MSEANLLERARKLREERKDAISAMGKAEDRIIKIDRELRDLHYRIITTRPAPEGRGT